MTQIFKKLMRKQLEESLESASVLLKKPAPKKGWIKMFRDALGMSSEVLAQRLSCSRSNITTIEQREVKGTISLETLERVAQAMNARVFYCFVPLEPFDVLLEKQARSVAKKRIKIIDHSMQLEQQGLSAKQLKQQEDELVQELLHNNAKYLWIDYED